MTVGQSQLHNVCKMLKRDPCTMSIPIIMLTTRSNEETNIIAGLKLCANDYLTKPFSLRILLAHVKATLRRSMKMPEAAIGMITYQDIRMHPGHRELRVGAQSITKFNILHMLAQQPG